MIRASVVSETEHMWVDLIKVLQDHIIKVNAEILKTTKLDQLQKIFDIGNPKIVIGIQAGTPYFRIHPDSIEPMKVIIKQYL